MCGCIDVNFQIGREPTKHDDEEQPEFTGHELSRQGGVHEEMSQQKQQHEDERNGGSGKKQMNEADGRRRQQADGQVLLATLRK